MIRTNPGADARHQQLLSQTAFSPEATDPQPGARMPHEQLYFASFPRQVVVTPPRTATIRSHPSDIRTDSATTYYRAGGVPDHSRSPTMPEKPLPVLPIDNQQRDLQFQRTAFPQAITTEQQLSKIPSGYFGAPEPYDDAPYDPRSLNSQLPAQNRESTYPSSPLNPTQRASYLTPQSEIASKSSPSPYMDEQVPALTTQPMFDWKGNADIVSHDPLLNKNGARRMLMMTVGY
jgi:hypothetical protein